MATALQMLARCPTLLRFAPCIHAFMPQNLFTRIMNTGSKQKKGDPDVQVRCANVPHSASFFRRVRTSRALRAVGQRTLVSEKRMLRSAGRRGRAAASNICDGLGSLKINLSSKKSFGLTSSGFVFSGCLYDAQRQPENACSPATVKSGYGGDTPCSVPNYANN